MDIIVPFPWSLFAVAVDFRVGEAVAVVAVAAAFAAAGALSAASAAAAAIGVFFRCPSCSWSLFETR